MDVDDAAFEAAFTHGDRGEDPHESLVPEETLSELTLVIPTNRERNFTRQTAPEWLDVVIATDEGLNVALNAGVRRADTDWILIADDDITFPTRLVTVLLDAIHPGHLVGLEDYWPMEYVLGRFLLFHRSLWAAVGGFDESRPHGGDTDFAIRCEKRGASVVRLPRHLIPHHDAASDLSTLRHAEWLWYLTRRHPRTVAPKAAKLVLRKIGLFHPRRLDYPDGWQSDVWTPPTDDE